MSEESLRDPLGNIRLLDRTNYAVWKEDGMKVLQGIMTWDIVMEREEEPEDPGRRNDFTRNTLLARKAYKDYKQRKLQALAIIYGSCTNAVKVYIKVFDMVLKNHIYTTLPPAYAVTIEILQSRAIVQESQCKRLWMHSTNARRIDR